MLGSSFYFVRSYEDNWVLHDIPQNTSDSTRLLYFYPLFGAQARLPKIWRYQAARRSPLMLFSPLGPFGSIFRPHD
jgi:hypothetical protein